MPAACSSLIRFEVTSMGLEEMYASPINLARQDPRMFDFIFNTAMR